MVDGFAPEDPAAHPHRQLHGPADVFAMFNEALDLRRGCHLALVFPGDVWAPDAVALLASQVTPTNVVYADEDALESNGFHAVTPDSSPSFRPTSWPLRPISVALLSSDLR